MCVFVLYKCLSGSTFSANLGERVHNIGVWLVVIWISLFSNAALRPGDRHNAFHSVHSRFQLVQRTEYRGVSIPRVWIQDPSFSRLDRQAGTIPIGLGR